ncbi:MAG: hypothetical protein RR585_10025 [Coprobacillus sp.]
MIGYFQTRCFEKELSTVIFMTLSQQGILYISYIISYFIDGLFSHFAISLSTIYYFILVIIVAVIVRLYYPFAQKIVSNPLGKHKNSSTLLMIFTFVLIYAFYLFYQYNSHSNILMYVFVIGVLGICFGIMKILEHTIDITKQEYETKLQNVELQHQKSTYQQVEKSIETLSQTRHDMVYILTHIKNMNENAQYEEIKRFINEQIERLEKMQKPIVTGNSTLDYVIYEFMPRFHKMNGHLTCNSYDGQCPITNVVYYAVVGEMLDIAIEYCKEDKNPTIMIQHGISHNRYYTKIKFTCTSELNNDLLVHLKELLAQYHYDYMESKDVNMYEIGFLLTQ